MTEQPQQALAQDYIVTARKWRPQRFTDVVGQDHVSTTLRNAVLSGRIHHAYMFNGPRGVGKTTSARVLAKAVNCENLSATAEPCGVCQSCTDIVAGRSLDVVEIDGASNNSVEDIRTLRENAKYPPIAGRYKMYIIDEVHMLSTSAFNALLKILEEPPKHLLFVFATTEPHKVPATILSRCQRFDFRRMQIEEIATHLRTIADAESIITDEESLLIIAKKGDGSMRDSQSIFDQAVAFCGMNLQYQQVNEALNLIDTEFFFTISKAIYEHDVTQMLSIARDVFMRGYDMQECLLGLAEHFRNILTVKATGTTDLIELAQSQKALYKREAEHFVQADILRLLTIVMTTEKELRSSPQPRLRFEFALVQMAQLDSAIVVGELLQELRALKKKIDSGVGVVASSPTHGSAPAKQEKHSTVQSAPVMPLSSASMVVRERGSEYQSSSAPQTTPKPAENNAPKPIAKMLSAHELQTQWERFAVVSDLPAGFSQYLVSGLITVEFQEHLILLKPMQPFLADTITEFLPALTSSARSYFGQDIRLQITGVAPAQAGSASSKGSSFSKNFSAPVKKTVTMPDTGLAPKIQSAGQDSPMPSRADMSQNSSQDSSQNSSQNSPLRHTPGAVAHPLDEAILAHFNAMEISLR